MIKKLYYFIYELYVKVRSVFGNKYIKKLKDTHKGERCFIVCTGPSLTLDDLELIKDEFSFSMNSIVRVFDKVQYRPNIYMIQDSHAFKRIESDIKKNLHEIDLTLLGSIIKFRFPFIKIPQNAKRKVKNFNLSLLGHNLASNRVLYFSKDPSRIFYDGFTITYSAFQLAVYMGFKDIYFLGNDCNYSGKKKHFDGSGEKNVSYENSEDNMQFMYSFIKSIQSSLDVNIYNATRGGKLEEFPRVALEDIIGKKE